ncbi:MAG: methionyl-tRNA formyltransferase [Patescibacteria group bacterium]
MPPENQKQRIVFFGTPEIAAETLRTLRKAGFNIIGAVTQPDKPTGRQGALTPPPAKVTAQELSIPVFQPATLRDGVFLNQLRELRPDLCIVISYGKIFPPEFLNAVPLGFINVHYSLLPKYRGASPLQTAIMNGDKESGVTVALLEPEVDSGPILDQKKIAIPGDLYYEDLLKEYGKEGAEFLVVTLKKYLSGEIKPQKQDHAQATLAKVFTRDDGRINWSRPVEQIYNRVRALGLEPGTWTTWNGETLKIIKAHPATEENHDDIGMVSERDGNIVVSTGHGSLALEIIQIAGGRAMSAKEFINGKKDFIGSVLE